jgi:hypothetical protein
MDIEQRKAIHEAYKLQMKKILISYTNRLIDHIDTKGEITPKGIENFIDLWIKEHIKPQPDSRWEPLE